MTPSVKTLNKTCRKSKIKVRAGWVKSLSVDLIGRNSLTNLWQNKRPLPAGESGFGFVHPTRVSWLSCSEALWQKPLFTTPIAICLHVARGFAGWYWGALNILPARAVEITNSTLPFNFNCWAFGHTQTLPQKFKAFLIQWLCQDVCNLFLSPAMF